MNNHRKPLVFAFGVMAGVLLLTSTAFACTAFRGRFTVTPTAPGTGSVTAVGSNSGMNYCAGPTGTATFAAPYDFTAAVTAAAGITGCNGGNGSKLSPGLYTVTYNYGTSVNNNGQYIATINDCMNLSTRQLGSMVVDANGDGSGSYRLPASLNNIGDAQICVSDPTGGQGNQVPVKLI